ncbi:probable NADH dehydrogenase [ubiquinone] 1 alpha subcomplex subunit 5 [Halyomorpha halys]|uniref:probable NADH dehydrogenase [ubiquinone] 1 alpha subcomplex subunit 5 n=1 Tax=Halyomorpha halys TaxID=286706 RepID=UPI0006D4D9A6|nr:probable NADH dehydrogenase [ubiquinone] 1 alpha subcomplex subunit 5 [Halyomorpha halys]
MNVLKKTTGLTGLAVSKDPSRSLTLLYGKILRALQKLPQEAFYRKNTEELINKRMALVQSAKTPADIEQQINCGQVEELIIQAENELRLIRNLAYSKPWEPLIAPPPPNQWTWPPTK